MQAELEKNNQYLSQENEMLKRLLHQYQGGEVSMYKDFTPQPMSDREMSGHVLPQNDESHDAALLLNLKQGHDLVGTRSSPPGPHRRLGERGLSAERIRQLWDEYFENYHDFLPILDRSKDTPDVVYEQSEFLFWTIILIAARHFPEDTSLLQRLVKPYLELIKETICKPPNGYHMVKGLCLVCTWPPPVSSTSSDMAFFLSGVMMKFAMHLGLHRPSHPMDFSRFKVQLREEDIRDRLQTWLACNLVAQNISTGYGQPPDTVYDGTLSQPVHNPFLQTRLDIEKLADKITRTVYSPQLNSGFVEDSTSLHVKAAILAQDLQRFDSIADLSNRKLSIIQ
jgi:Fungal specific transcription factor domain